MTNHNPMPALVFLLTLFCSSIATTVHAESGNAVSKPVNITAELSAVQVMHRAQPVSIVRIQDNQNKLVDDFAKTSRPCPPFCIHPIEAAPGVRTIGEIELLDFLSLEVAEKQGVLIDARMPNWYNSETIPTAINIPFIVLAKPSPERNKILELLGGKKEKNGHYNFLRAKKLCLFCNGPWCDQSPRAIKSLIKAGYPAEKLLYYRGGMQLWKLLGLTTILPKTQAVDDQDNQRG